jgi:hypothetical protein
MVVGHQDSRHAASFLPRGSAPRAADFLRFFLIESPMQVPVNKHGWDILFMQYSHYEVREELFISIKFDNVIKVLVRTGYGNIKV